MLSVRRSVLTAPVDRKVRLSDEMVVENCTGGRN